MNPVQLVVKRVLRIPHIRRDDITWYEVHLAPISGAVIVIALPGWKMTAVEQFRHAKNRQHPHVPIEYIGSNEMLMGYLQGARQLGLQSMDGGVTWTEFDWSSLL